MSKNNKKFFYKTFNEDVVTNENQDYKIKKGYVWIHNNLIYRFFSSIFYFLVRITTYLYGKFFLHIKIENREILNKYKNSGYFLYGNHTQIIGDVFIPAHVNGNKRIYTVVSQANLGLKGIGKVLPMLGAIPIPDSIEETKKFYETVKTRINQSKCVVIYPEAHVWPYYTDIRPFSAGSFKFSVDCNCPSFCMTTTYQKRKLGKKPKITVYVDGPFMIDEKLSKKQNETKLHDEIYKCMKNRCSNNSTYQYVEYEKTT